MRLIKIGIANVDPTVGALRANTNRSIAMARAMAAEECTIAAFSEQAIGGYPAEDLVQWSSFVSRQWEELKRFARETRAEREGGHPTVFVLGLTVEHGGHLYNAAAIVCDGRILGIVPKEKLPTYGVFYERRTFSAGAPGMAAEVNGVPFGDFVFKLPFGTMAVEVCEDLWSADGPLKRRAYSGAEISVNISASPWRAGIVATRREMISTRAADNCITVVYANQAGGNDSLVFDGGGFVNQVGRMILDAPRWREGYATTVVDLDRTLCLRRENTTWRADCEEYLRTSRPVPVVIAADGPLPDLSGYRYPMPAYDSFFMPPDAPAPNLREEYFQDLIEAMTAGLKGFFEKSGIFDHIGVALSGGKDSALTLIIARLYAERRFSHLPEEERAAAIKDFIHAISMPYVYSSETTKYLARRLAEELGVTFVELPIENEILVGTSTLERLANHLDLTITPIAAQNLQARTRGKIMWQWSNMARGLWLQTGNMSERAVGYTTVGGDLMGAYSLIGNLPKTVIIALLGYLAEHHPWPAVKELLATKSSAELAPGQEDERELMPFPVLDACYALFVGEKLSPREVYRVLRSMWSDDELAAMYPGFEPPLLKEWVQKFIRLFRSSIFKWVQAPETVHLGSLDLDRERALQLPVVQSPEWLALGDLDGA
ncbi:MAG: NAD(+) synthase [bacterium]|nr:NAD(+) synthase [bacterium]